MKVLQTIRRIVATGALFSAGVTAQTAPAFPPTSVPSGPSSGKPTAALPPPASEEGASEFKPQTQDPRVDPKGPVVVPVRPPAPVPGGPRVIEGPPPTNDASTSRPVPPLSSGPAGSPKLGKPHVLGPLDVVEVRVWNDPKLNGIFDIGTDGTISVPLVGAIMASGLTAAELTAVIREKLSVAIIEPEVLVQVLRNNSKKFTILGGCGRTGEFPLIGEVTVLDALANCGGFREFANLKKIYVLRGTKQLKFNYRDVIRGRHMEQNIVIEPGDRIVVPDN